MESVKIVKKINKDNKIKLKKDCTNCKASFDVYLSELNLSSERDEKMRANYGGQCPVCRILEKSGNQDTIK